MMDMPHVYTPEALHQEIHEVAKQRPDGSWGPTRPACYFGLCFMSRMKLTWRVFTGKADILEWNDHETQS